MKTNAKEGRTVIKLTKPFWGDKLGLAVRLG